MGGDEVGVYRAALRRAVEAVLAAYPQDAVTVEEGVNSESPEEWGVEVIPAVEGAAAVYVSYGGGDEVTVGLGETHAYLWGNPEPLADEIQEIFHAVFAGRFVEAGPRGDAFAKVSTARGEISLGAAHLPLPWRLRRTRTYAPYSAPQVND